MNSGLSRLFNRVIFLSLPFVVLLAAYVVLDPFKVVRHHDVFYSPDTPLILNRDYVSTEIFVAQDPSRHYDSFVVGNSRTLAFLCDDWAAYLDEGSVPYHFDASSETLYGVWTKLRFLDRRGTRLKNVFFLLDASVLEGVGPSKGHLTIKDPITSGESRIAFQRTFLTAYFGSLFAVKFLDYTLFHQARPYMAGSIDDRRMAHQADTNDLRWASSEEEIAAKGEAYWQARARIFAARSRGALPPTIGPRQRAMLDEIAAIFGKHGARFEVVVSPLYDRQALAADDVRALREIFGAEHVHDFSGDGEIARDVHDWYEAFHFRPVLARRILERVYSGSRSAVH